MAKWDDTTLTSETTLNKWESEIADIYNNISDKITLAKKILKRRIEQNLRAMGYNAYIDYDADEEIINLINNADVFDLCSDCKTLELIYKDLSDGDKDSDFGLKMLDYAELYEKYYQNAITNLDFDYDQDNTTDEYKQKIYNVGRVTR